MASPVTNAAADEEWPLGKDRLPGSRRSLRCVCRFSRSGRTRPKNRFRRRLTTALEKARAITSRRNKISECFTDLRAGRVEAISTDAAILAGYKARFPTEFAHWDLGLDTVEAWGVNVGENQALKKLVDLTLYRSLKDPRDDRWEEAYATNLQSEVPANETTPIAQAQQPDVPKPEVREQPWEEVF